MASTISLSLQKKVVYKFTYIICSKPGCNKGHIIMIILGFVKSYLNCVKSVSNLRSFEFAVISFLLGFSSLSLKCNSYFIS